MTAGTTAPSERRLGNLDHDVIMAVIRTLGYMLFPIIIALSFALCASAYVHVFAATQGKQVPIDGGVLTGVVSLASGIAGYIGGILSNGRPSSGNKPSSTDGASQFAGGNIGTVENLSVGSQPLPSTMSAVASSLSQAVPDSQTTSGNSGDDDGPDAQPEDETFAPGPITSDTISRKVSTPESGQSAPGTPEVQ